MHDPDQALRAWEQLLTPARVSSGPDSERRYGPNITEFRPRRLVATLRPQSRAEVVALVNIANEFDIPLYPISRGCNWGVGSKLPPKDGCAIVDLSEMNAITMVDAKLGVAIVEPGVSQTQLAAYLRDADIPWVLNVTGAGGNASVLGNALERGVGMLGQRDSEICALEVVLGHGDVLRLGFDHLHHSIAAGPSLMGLFTQSNFGIVTSMAVSLFPRQQASLFFMDVADSALEEFVDGIRELRTQGVCGHRTEIMAGNDPRLAGMLTQASKAKWGIWGAVYGSSRMRAIKREEIAAKLEARCNRLLFFEQQDEAAQHPDIVARFELACGEPSDFSVRAMVEHAGIAFQPTVDLDHERAVPGMVVVVPAVPLVGDQFRQLTQLVDEESKRLSVPSIMSFATISNVAAEGFVRLHFNRNRPEHVAAAHAWVTSLDRKMRDANIALIRLSVDQMDTYRDSLPEQLGQCMRRVKQALDPKRIIAPGRYEA